MNSEMDIDPNIAAAVIVATATLLAAYIKRGRYSKSAVRIVDVDIDELGMFPKLDIKVRNVGKKVAFLKNVTLKVLNVWGLEPLSPLLAATKASEDYVVFLQPSKHPYMEEVPISHTVEPNDTDRFTIQIGTSLSDRHEYIYRINVAITYNENSRKAKGWNVMLLTPDLSIFDPSYVFSDIEGVMNSPRNKKILLEMKNAFKELECHNRKVVREISKIKGKKSKRLLTVVDNIISAERYQ